MFSLIQLICLYLGSSVVPAPRANTEAAGSDHIFALAV